MTARQLQHRGALVWLAAAFLVALTHQWVPESTWLLVHLIFLGALTQAILVWSRHFAHSLLRSRPRPAEQKRHHWRLILHSLGAVGVMTGVVFALWPLVIGSATVVAAAVIWHGIELWRAMRSALPGRFKITIYYYLAAAAMLPVGATFGVLLAASPAQYWFPRLLAAHISSMVLGWVLLTVVGTLLTFWPTMLRARIDERAERLTSQALAWLLAGIVLTIVAVLISDAVSVTVALLVYSFGLVWFGRGLLRPLMARRPREFAPVSVGLSLVWLVVGLVWLAIRIASSGIEAIDGGLGDLLAVFAVGFGAQLLTGALTFLVPSVGGGGPFVVRTGMRELHRLSAARLLVINLGLAVWLAPISSWLRVTLSSAVLLVLGAFLVLAIRATTAMRAARAVPQHERKQRDIGSAVTSVWSRRDALLGLGLLATAGAVGGALTWTGGGLSAQPTPRDDVTPSGNTTSVRVVAKDMRFLPDSVEVPRGDMLKVTLINEDEVDAHDLRIGDRVTDRLQPGDQAVLEYGPVGQEIEGYCTIVGHRAAGMTFTVRVRE